LRGDRFEQLCANADVYSRKQSDATVTLALITGRLRTSPGIVATRQKALVSGSLCNLTRKRIQFLVERHGEEETGHFRSSLP
jgi:hypothetical protein